MEKGGKFETIEGEHSQLRNIFFKSLQKSSNHAPGVIGVTSFPLYVILQYLT